MKRSKMILIGLIIGIFAGGITMFYYPHACSGKIIEAIQNNNITAEEFKTIVEKNKRGLNCTEHTSPVMKALDVTNYCPIHYACMAGNTKKVAILLKAGADPNLRDEEKKSTPLLFALNSGKAERFMIAEMLLEAGADANATDRWSSPLFSSLIITNNDKQEQKEQSFQLFEQLIKIVHSTKDPAGADTLLGRAAAFGNIKATDYILNQSINTINEVSEIGRTALMSCVMTDNVDMCRYLIKRGSDETIEDNEGDTAYDYAIRLHHDRCAQLLKQGT